MDATESSNDFNKTIDSEGDKVESSHLQVDSIPSDSQSKEVVEPIHLHLDSSSSEAQSLVKFDDLLMDSTPGTQLVVGEILLNGDAQVVDNHASNLGQCSYDPQVAYLGPSSSASDNSFTYNGVTYYSYEAFGQDFRRQLLQEMQRDGVIPRYDDVDEPQFSDSMVFATGGSPAVINPHNGLPWRKGANLCRPYIDEGCCRFGTACIFHHPWPPTKELP